MKPITPAEVKSARIASIPDAIIEAVNNLITKKWDGYSATILQKDIVTEYFKVSKKKRTDKAVNDLFENHHMDFEHSFRQAGWVVDYDRPAYNESYEPNFTFTKKKKNEDD